MVRADTFDLGGLRLRAGDGRSLELEVLLDPLELGGQTYGALPERVPVTLDVSRTNGGGFSLRLRFEAAVNGPCMRCLADAAPAIGVDVREVDLPGGGEELDSPYVEHELLDLRGWAHDAFALAVPDQILCAPDCLGLCPVCAVPLRDAGPEHHHERSGDPRWAKLAELRLD
ncbi:MAG: DUF177 domain-containing protein [Solirubrobacteraceae bacterium]